MEHIAQEAVKSIGQGQSDQTGKTVVYEGEKNKINLKEAVEIWKSKLGDINNKSKFGCIVKSGENFKLACAFD
ncbi:hypothetical protein Y032_0020g73 [Ancylostoma ceylanicum]|nr:hypothetical protein Y032_0020g73 [Ancylostoma ceylanicum]